MDIPFEMSKEAADRDFEELFGVAPPPPQAPQPEAKKKKSNFSSTASTLKWARKVYGDLNVYNASHWQTGIRPVRKDMWGFQDVQVLDGLPGVLALQACGSDVGAHQRKMAGEVRYTVRGSDEKAVKASKKAAAEAAKLEARVRAWLAAGNRLLMVAWRPVWVTTGLFHKTKKMQPRFLEAVLDPGPEGLSLGLSDREVEWIEHETWPPTGRKETKG